MGSTSIQHNTQAVHKKQKQRNSKTTEKKKPGQSTKDAELKKLPIIPENTTEDDWINIKKGKVYETELGDICIVAAARALKRNIMVFNTNKKNRSSTHNPNQGRKL